MEQPTPTAPFIAEIRRYMDHRKIVIEEVTKIPNKTGADLMQVLFEGGTLPIPRFHIQMAVLVGPDKQHLMQIPIHATFDAADIQDAFTKAEAEIQAATQAEIKRRQEEALKPKLVTPH